MSNDDRTIYLLCCDRCGQMQKATGTIMSCHCGAAGGYLGKDGRVRRTKATKVLAVDEASLREARMDEIHTGGWFE